MRESGTCVQQVRSTARVLPLVATSTRRIPSVARLALIYFAALAILVALAQMSLLATRMPLRIELDSTTAQFTLDGSHLRFPLSSRPTSVQFVRPPNTFREFQIDGTDSANNFTEDPAYFAGLAASRPYYAFQSWMRASDSYSSWHDVSAAGITDGKVVASTSLADGESDTRALALPHTERIVVSAALERVEVPVHVELICGSAPCADLEIDRNDRFIQVQAPGVDTTSAPASNSQRAFFPTQPLPFLAEVLYVLFEIGIWSLVVFGLATFWAVSLAGFAAGMADIGKQALTEIAGELRKACTQLTARIPRLPEQVSRVPGDRWDALAATVVLASCIWTLYVSRVLFAGQPHILDANAYIFQAKIFASGQLSTPAPALAGAFRGPFMIVAGGRWFSQYPPMTCALLALGLLIHLPWIVEPLLGSLALWGMYRIGRRLFDARTGVLALLLGALSPFYTFLAASYMSHAIALFFCVYFVLALLRFTGTFAVRDLVLAAVCAGCLVLTRELAAALTVGVGLVYVGVVCRRRLWEEREHVVLALVAALPIVFLTALVYLTYNLLQTGDPTLTPRLLFDPTEQYGFGAGIGFYGQHTPAAGFVNLEQMLTTLLIDLYGWPFYLTLAFLVLALLRRGARGRWDLFCLVMFAVAALAQVGYYYHGIYLGPRFLYETLPYLLLLTARGILALPALAGRAAETLLSAVPRAPLYASARIATGCVVAVLLLCNLLYYLPRQVQLANGFTGLPYYKPVDAAALYAFHPPSAIVLTGDWMIYNYILFSLNDPNLRGPTLYAFDDTGSEAAALAKQYPDRAIYMLQVDAHGHPTFIKLTT
ncbi:MAG TPA: glycosyltransferase family 39 protein [Ktedonobacterales bacterium]